MQKQALLMDNTKYEDNKSARLLVFIEAPADP